MPNYVQDGDRTIQDAFGGSGSYGQKPGPKPDNYYDKIDSYTTGSICKSPNYILILGTLTSADLGFFFGSSASFAAKVVAEGAVSITLNDLTGSEHYQSIGTPAADTKLDLHPTAWSGSAADNLAGRVKFIYKGGLDGSGGGG